VSYFIVILKEHNILFQGDIDVLNREGLGKMMSRVIVRIIFNLIEKIERENVLEYENELRFIIRVTKVGP